MKRRPHPVTDHAVLRYLERVCGVDIEAIRGRIHAECWEALRAGAARKTCRGVRYRIKNGRVVTVIYDTPKTKKLRW
jgi:hypothetical protein